MSIYVYSEILVYTYIVYIYISLYIYTHEPLVFSQHFEYFHAPTFSAQGHREPSSARRVTVEQLGGGPHLVQYPLVL